MNEMKWLIEQIALAKRDLIDARNHHIHKIFYCQREKEQKQVERIDRVFDFITELEEIINEEGDSV